MPDTLRVAFVGSHDLCELFLESGGEDQEHGLAANLSASTHVEFSLPPQGWTSMLGTLRSNGSTDPFDVLLTSATAELNDPGREPREALIELARFAGERHPVHVVVLNASTLLSGPDTAGHISRDADPLDLRIRRLNLAIMEASKATGLSVLDADRLVAETRFPIKVAGVLGYAPEIYRVLRIALSSILAELGYAGRPTMGARVPFIGPVAELSVGRWLKSEGDDVVSGDVLCEIRLRGRWKMRRPTTAVVLASIKGRGLVVRQIVNREQVRRREFDGVGSLVAGDNAVLRKVLRPEGEHVRPGELLAILSGDQGTRVDGPEVELGPFRVALRTDDSVVGEGRAPHLPGRKLSPRKRARREIGRLYSHITPEFITEKGRGWVSFRGTHSVLLRRGMDAPIRGIYLRGACDVPSLFTLAPLAIDRLEGSLCIHLSGHGVSGARSDLLLQAYEGVPEEFIEDIGTNLGLPRTYFENSLLEPRFTVRGLPGDRTTFPKTVVVLSVLPDLTRTVYRHREAGFLVDPGVTWLNNMKATLQDLSFVRWFSAHFEPVGRISTEGFAQNYRRLIPLIKQETGASVLVFNSLEIEPFDDTHDYSARSMEAVTRRRRFNITLNELSNELGFHIVDVDKILKTQGVERQVDFSHFPVERMRAVGEEALGILREINVV